jgi:hypothetical protein
VRLGRVRIAASSPIAFSDKSNVEHSVRLLQQLQSKVRVLSFYLCAFSPNPLLPQRVCVSAYHIAAAAQCLDITPDLLTRALGDAGAEMWEGACSPPPTPPTTKSESWSVALQCLHHFAPLLESPEWSSWLFASAPSSAAPASPAMTAVANALSAAFENAERGAQAAVDTLVGKGFNACELSAEHVLGYYDCAYPPAPLRNNGIKLVIGRLGNKAVEVVAEREEGEEPPAPGPDEEAFGAWGFADSKFVLTDKKTVMMQCVQPSHNLNCTAH